MKNFTRRLLGRFYTVRYSHVLSYKGSWRKGKFHGQGILKYRNGGIYEGNFRFGVNHLVRHYEVHSEASDIQNKIKQSNT